MPSMIGLIMLMGIATKNSILLVEYAIMARREHGMNALEALLDACHKRARPIVMTTIAMGAGMLPIALGLGVDPSFRSPMAIVVIGGLITSTFLSLLVIPVVFTYVDDAVLKINAWLHRKRPAQPDSRRRRARPGRPALKDQPDANRRPPIARSRLAQRARCCWPCAPRCWPCRRARRTARLPPRRAARDRRQLQHARLRLAGRSTRAARCRCACTCPMRPAPTQPVPLVVFSHGIGGSRSGYSYLGRYWASQGYASLHLQHVGSDRSVWFGNPFETGGPAAGRGAGGRGRGARARPELRARPGAGAASWRRGWTASASSRPGIPTAPTPRCWPPAPRVQRNGERCSICAIARIKAAIVLSAPPFYGEASPQQILGPIRVPSLHVTATEDIIRIPGYYSGAEDRVAVFDATGSPRKTLAVFSGGSHSIFTDRAGTGGAAAEPAGQGGHARAVAGLPEQRVQGRRGRAGRLAEAVCRHRRALHAAATP